MSPSDGPIRPFSAFPVSDEVQDTFLSGPQDTSDALTHLNDLFRQDLLPQVADALDEIDGDIMAVGNAPPPPPDAAVAAPSGRSIGESLIASRGGLNRLHRPANLTISDNVYTFAAEEDDSSPSKRAPTCRSGTTPKTPTKKPKLTKSLVTARYAGPAINGDDDDEENEPQSVAPTPSATKVTMLGEGETEREVPCLNCCKSLANGNSDGRCVFEDGKRRCNRCRCGSSTCMELPLVLNPFASMLIDTKKVHVPAPTPTLELLSSVKLGQRSLLNVVAIYNLTKVPKREHPPRNTWKLYTISDRCLFRISHSWESAYRPTVRGTNSKQHCYLLKRAILD